MTLTSPTTASRLVSRRQIIDEIELEYERRFIANRDGKILGPRFGIHSLDTAMGGWMEAGLFILHGAPGSGKTALAWQVAAECGMPCVYVSFELSSYELQARLIARKYRTHIQDIRRGRMPQEDFYTYAAELCVSCPHLFSLDATKGETPDEHELEAAINLVGNGHPSVLVVIDSLSTWTFARMTTGMSEYEAMNGAIEALERLAARLGVAVIAIAERNRASMREGGQNAVAGSRKAEYRAHCVMGLDFGDEGDIRTSLDIPVVLHVAKNHWGPSGMKVPLTFRPHFMEFIDPTAPMFTKPQMPQVASTQIPAAILNHPDYITSKGARVND